MKKTRVSEEQIVFALQLGDSDTPVAEMCRLERALPGECAGRLPLGDVEALKLVLLQACARDQRALRMRIRDIAMNRPRFGYLRIHVMLRREGWE